MKIGESAPFSPREARSRLSDFVDAAPSVNGYRELMEAIHTTHELPFAVASLYQTYGRPIMSLGGPGTPGFDFRRSSGLTMVAGRYVFDTVRPNPEISIQQARYRLNNRSKKNIRSTRLHVTQDITDSVIDRSEVYRLSDYSNEGYYEARSGMANRIEGVAVVDTSLLQRLSNVGVDSCRDNDLALQIPTASLRKMTKALLRVTRD